MGRTSLRAGKIRLRRPREAPGSHDARSGEGGGAERGGGGAGVGRGHQYRRGWWVQVELSLTHELERRAVSKIVKGAN